ncbi:MAG TPA: cellulase N-terminal Ig-like domain-containing protein, partial [Flavisolibacter sp.]|nr:cellulase N-terminal Ig-like domain-containing protein [Flavisolibacter sp.]
MRTLFTFLVFCVQLSLQAQTNNWIRINLLGYQPQSSKVAVWGSKGSESIATFE